MVGFEPQMEVGASLGCRTGRDRTNWTLKRVGLGLRVKCA